MFDNQNFACIKSDFCFLFQVITKLQNQNLKRRIQSLQIRLINAKDRVLQRNGRVAGVVKHKASMVLQTNKRFNTLQPINKILNGNSNKDNLICQL